MSLPLTPAMISGCYDFLRTTPPFNKWRLPPGVEIGFRVGRDPALRGWYRRYRNLPTIVISCRSIGHTTNLIQTVAHEMIHLFEDLNGLETRGEHSANFNRLAARVCKSHGWDPKLF